MSTFIKMATFAIILHVFFYVTMNMVYVPDTTSEAIETGGQEMYRTLGEEADIYRIEPDLFTIFAGKEVVGWTESYKDNWTEYQSLNTTKLAIPGQVGGETIGTNVISFLDPLKIVYPILTTLWNIGVGPLAVLTSNKINPIFQILIGMSYAIVAILALIAFIRGASD